MAISIDPQKNIHGIFSFLNVESVNNKSSFDVYSLDLGPFRPLLLRRIYKAKLLSRCSWLPTDAHPLTSHHAPFQQRK
jgi:hypothetical protein